MTYILIGLAIAPIAAMIWAIIKTWQFIDAGDVYEGADGRAVDKDGNLV